MIKHYPYKSLGGANHGWLKSKHHFSFAEYYNPSRMGFGKLRVINDDWVEPGMGFPSHPHQNMEIISIPLKGSLKHKDSMSKTWIPLETGEVQVMTAGTGIMHSEKNNSVKESVNLFQIWIIPDQMGAEPSYDQMKFDPSKRKNQLQTLVTSYKDKASHQLKVHQDALISRLDLGRGNTFDYKLKSKNHGVYIMLISGELVIDDLDLKKRDALGIWQTELFAIKAREDTEILFIEVPMVF
jgi:redox-sensitive bicupin YhaK (pirin superfamily)